MDWCGALGSPGHGGRVAWSGWGRGAGGAAGGQAGRGGQGREVQPAEERRQETRQTVRRAVARTARWAAARRAMARLGRRRTAMTCARRHAMSRARGRSRTAWGAAGMPPTTHVSPPARTPRSRASSSASWVVYGASACDVAGRTIRTVRSQHPSGPLMRHARDQDGTETEGTPERGPLALRIRAQTV